MNTNDLQPPAAPPSTRLAPVRIAEDTYVISDHQGEGTAPVVVHLNAMVIRGEQPVVVDTGAPLNRATYLDDLFGLVEPDDVRWVFLSHDDVDHYGNVEAVMDACPNATLLTSWFTMERLGAEGWRVPPTRWRWLADDEPLDIGDRQIVPVRPPLYDSPTTRGLFDTRTRAYWAADCFAAPVPVPAGTVGELDLDVWVDGLVTFQQWNSPWVEALDVVRWQATMNAFEALDAHAIAGCHGPAAVDDAHLLAAYDALRRLPELPIAPQPGQELLDQILAQMPLGTPA